MQLFCCWLPDAHRSYTELEGRVEKLELEQIVIKNAIKARLYKVCKKVQRIYH